MIGDTQSAGEQPASERSAASDRSSDPGGPVAPAADRRRFLLGAGAVIGAGALLPRSLTGEHQAAEHARAGARTQRAVWLSSDRSGPSNADWAALRASLSTHDLVRPGQRDYRQAKQLFDPRFDRLEPAGIAYCGRPNDVAACLSFATRFKLAVRARSGGHSYAGWSSVTGGLVVDVSRMSSFGVGNGTVRVGAGLALIDFYNHLAARGLAVPGGSCPTVGIAGLALGGGIGVVARQYGLTSDALEGVQMVTADGSVLNCSSSLHSDLLWACRGGGGGNFGVATAFTFRTHHLRQLVLFFLSWPWSQAGRVVNAWQSWAPHAPDALWSNLHLSAPAGTGGPVVQVGGTYVGSVHGAARLLQELYARVGSGPSSSFLKNESYLDAMLVEAGCAQYSVPECRTGPAGRLPRVPSYAKSDFFSRKLSASGIRTLLSGIERLRGVRGASGGGGAIAFDALGGAVNRVHPNATAFVHRDALFGAQYSTSWNYPGSSRGVANQHAWLRSYYAAVHPHANGQAYQNYVDPDLTNWRQAYYGSNYARLARIKGRYDPHQLFRFPQGITPPGVGAAD
ncbi:MAG: FAD-binding oxidoreductase [Streptosporangiaceae bacterium]|jgi:FAD/FMN-containing dehydrogenase